MNESKKRHSFWRTAEIVLILLLIAVLLFIAVQKAFENSWTAYCIRGFTGNMWRNMPRVTVSRKIWFTPSLRRKAAFVRRRFPPPALLTHADFAGYLSFRYPRKHRA